MKGHHYIILILLLAVGAWYAVKRGWLRKPAMPAAASGGESV
jgi:hypothetical protein